MNDERASVPSDEQSAFEDWLELKCPSGDVESVQRQWLSSSAHRDWYDEQCSAATTPMPADRERAASLVASDRAFSYALGLATTLWARYYKAQSPSWQPLEDTLGLLTQIDNMIAGIPAYARVDSLVADEDTKLLDWMEKHRVSVIPEFEGPWDATVYGDEGEPQSVASGSTPREAIAAARASAGEAQS